MSDLETRFHETWLGLVQPTEGLVVSVPVLTDALCMARQRAEVQETLLDLTRGDGDERVITDLGRFFEEILQHPPAHFDAGDALPADLSLYVPEGQQTLRPTLALLADPQTRAPRDIPADASPAITAAAPYVALVWDVPDTLALDKPETTTGPWDYPLAAKLDRLLRHTQVSIGILTNRRVLRLVYAPHGESSGHIDFRVDHMAAIDGRPILDALVMLLSTFRFYAAGPERTLPALLAASRKRQADVTNDLAEQVLDAVQILLRGFELAAERDGSFLLREAVQREDDHVYGGLLTVLLRLVFVLYAEDWSLLPVQSRVWAQHYSVLGLFEQLQADHGAHPDSMSRRFGAWSRLIALFRAIYLGLDHTVLGANGERDVEQSISMPPRRGHLFDPERFPFLEGWPEGGAAPIKDPEARAAVRVPSIDDATVFAVLHRLVLYRPEGADHGQRLSYRALDVEQLGSVYEGLMGYHVEPLAHDAVALKVKNKRSAARAWVDVDALLAEAPARRVSWLQDALGFDKATAKKVADSIKGANDVETAIGALLDLAAGKSRSASSKDRRARLVAPAGRLVLQPGPERRRTSSHYTPRELSAPIVRRTLEPLFAVMGDAPASERILNLKICDPAMGSGAFLVEACRYVGDEVVKAWTREHALPKGEEPTLAARRLVAQRCLYGVDKNAYAVDLAKLSLWLVTLAKDHPFTFLDHSLRHGDSLVGLDFDQIRAGHWKVERGLQKKQSQLEIAELTLREALAEAIAIRQEILELAKDASPAAQRLKEQKLADAEDALGHARLLADLIVGAFFAHDKDKDRERERKRRLDAFTQWKATGDVDLEEQLHEWQRQLRDPASASPSTGSPSPSRDAVGTDSPSRVRDAVGTDSPSRSGSPSRLREGVGGRAGVHPVPAFHWMLEFPEVFYAERPDPLDENQVNRAAYMDAFVGNPPFLGGSALSTNFGEPFMRWLLAVHEGSHGNADLSAHFFRRAGSLIGAHGSVGLIATNTIAQGDSRSTGLQRLVRDEGFTIYDATRSLAWPGDAAVSVSVVHLAKGRLAKSASRCRLDGVNTQSIDSQLRPAIERADAVRLDAMASSSFLGSKIYGQGFVLRPEERDELLARNPHNDARIFPYLGGEEVNSSPTRSHERYVISFAQMPLREAERWPDLLSIVREKVKPERDRLREDTGPGAHGKKWWWQFQHPRQPLYEAIAEFDRCLVNSQVSKH
ncbi:MAG: N-6 DNA methylase, partial [Sandaracinaceae bacterium]|nr:N-6 DNA methylase [Sandaracinaceae bacterium]